MKATGVIRAVDKLGRIVIPKEIRKNYRIREGDPMEIFTARDGEIILKKYSPMGELTNYAKSYAKAMSQVTGKTVIITDRDQVVAAEGRHKKEYENRSISLYFERVMEDRKVVNTFKSDKKKYAICEGENITDKNYLIYPVICQGDVIGSVGLVCDENHSEVESFEEKLLCVSAAYLGSLFI